MRASLVVGCLALAWGGCDVYSARSGEYSAGGVDPATFPPAYLGTGGNRTKPGTGSFTEVQAFAGGQALGYYAFPFSTAQLNPPRGTTVDPLRIVDAGKPYMPVPVPKGYDLSGVACAPPANYVYDGRTDEVPYDVQLDVFTALPTATYSVGFLPSWSYVPLIARVPVSGGGIDCEGIKSETTLQATPSLQVGPADGTYLARAIIDPDAAVYRVGQTQATSFGWGTQKLGWYNHYIVAYLDGGALPTTSPDGGPTVQMVPMALYFPRAQVMKGTLTVSGGIGFGYDVVDAKRGDPAYSPVCQVFSYDTFSTIYPIEQLPHDVATIKAMFGTTIQPANPPYIYCLQVQP